MKTTLGERGQVTIPKALRDQFGLIAGMELEVHEEAGRIVLLKPDLGQRLEPLIGSVENPYGSTDEFLRQVRD